MPASSPAERLQNITSKLGTMAFSYNKSNLAKKLFINNEYVDSKNSAKLSVYNPVDNSLVADDIALAGAEDVDFAVAQAEKAFPAWRAMSAIERRGIMLKFAELVEKNAVALAELTRITLGAPFEGTFVRFHFSRTSL